MSMRQLAVYLRQRTEPHDWLRVVQQPGWRTRGRGPIVPSLVLYHHTAGSRRAGPLASLSLVLDGRPRGLPNALANVYRSRIFPDGHVELHVVAAGYVYHAGRGGFGGYTSRQTAGLEAENDGLGEPWHARELIADLVALAALLDCGPHAGDAAYMIGHKEWAPGRKIDPYPLDMDERRTALRSMIAPAIPQVRPEGDQDMKAFLAQAPGTPVYLVTGARTIGIPTAQDLAVCEELYGSVRDVTRDFLLMAGAVLPPVGIPASSGAGPGA